MRHFFAFPLVVAVVVASAGPASAQPIPTETVPPIIIDVPPQPMEGLLKVCKVAGTGIAVGTPFIFTAGGSTVTVPAGPAPGGTCMIGPRFPVGTPVTVSEAMPAGTTVSSIAVAPPAQQVGAPNLAGGSVNIIIGAGVTEVTFVDNRTGFVEICKQGEVTGSFKFTVNPGGLGPFTVPAGACSPAIEVAAGPVTIHELANPGTTMTGCATVPAAQQGPCNLGTQTSTVTVVPGDVSTMTIAFITNKKGTGELGTDISLGKKFARGPAAGSGAYTLTVKNEGAPIPAGTVVKINDAVPVGVTLSGFGTGSGAGWSCMPTFPVVGPAPLTCSYTVTAPVATGALLPNLVLNATLAAIGTEPGIYSNCATVALTTAAGAPVTETNTLNNRACAVTTTINPVDCATGKCPTPVAECKQDVLMVIDASLSITQVGLGSVNNAIAGFLQPMKDKGGRVNIFSFSNQPHWSPITTGVWTPVTNVNWSTLANSLAITGDKTNWDDALERAYNVILGLPLGSPRPLVIFTTDGDPNAYNDASGLENNISVSQTTAATEAVQWINAIRNLGSPIIAIGFGQVASSGYLDAAFTGNSSGPGNINFETSSVIKMSSVGDLPRVMATLGNQMCGTLSLNKIGGGYFEHWPAAGATTVPVDDTIPFRLELTNNHATMAVSAVVVQDRVKNVLNPVVPGTASIGTATVGPYSPLTGTLLTWTIPSLLPRQTHTLDFTGRFVKTFPLPVVGTPINETHFNFAQVTNAVGYNATALGNMDPVAGPVGEVDEAVATFTEHIYIPVDKCAATPKPVECYVQLVSKVQNNPESCTSAPPGGAACQYTVNVILNSTNIPAGSTVTVVDTFTLAGNPVSNWAATVPPTFCPSATPTTVPFNCQHGSLNSFSGVMTVMIPPGQSGALKNCITVTVANTTVTPLLNVPVTACAP